MGRESEHSQGIKALAIKSESGIKSKESQIILSMLFYERGLTLDY
jgi:hypothetical protein